MYVCLIHKQPDKKINFQLVYDSLTFSHSTYISKYILFHKHYLHFVGLSVTQKAVSEIAASLQFIEPNEQ